MTGWRCAAPGKVNLSLFVGRPRSDGYHPLVSLVQPLSLADDVALEPAAGTVDELICAGVDGENLAVAALAAYRAATGWDAPPQRVTIIKRVPIAAGMGGGSADAAAVLRLASAAHGRSHEDPAHRALLAQVAAGLGADVDAARRCAALRDGRHRRALGRPSGPGAVRRARGPVGAAARHAGRCTPSSTASASDATPTSSTG